jgi:uncharacterized repeat protein (TIGR03847 family)
MTRILRRAHLELPLQAMTDQPTTFAALSYYDEDDVYPVSRITAAPVGDPRQRYFILQAHIGDEPVSWVIERDQARALSRQIPVLLTGIRSEFPELADPLVAAEPNLTLTEPWQPLFRVGSLGIGYDRLHDLVVFTLVDADTLEAMEDPQTEETDDPEQLVYTTRGQALLLAQQTERVVAAGRPYCPHCDEPIFDFGHFCPSSNARKGRHNEYVH